MWSTWPRRASGEITSAGIREPGPQRSPCGGATGSHQPPFSSWVMMITVLAHCGPRRMCSITVAMWRSPDSTSA
ncbi:hypothetical protein XF14_22350 [Burkholderia gladioli]|nr:hypothetical protein XF14_22350 [Burkholderia gladioli]